MRPATDRPDEQTMHEYFFQPEVVRTALVVGVVVSILFYERVQLTTGGAIVPAYLAMFLPAPIFVVTTLISAYLTYFVVSVVVAKRRILYGRRKFEVEMLVGLGFVAIGTGVTLLLRDESPLYFGLAGIGFLVPGVIAHEMFRQGPRKTLLALGATTAIVALFVFIFASLLEISPAASELPEVPASDTSTGYPLALILPAVVTSVVAGMFVFARAGLRSGGFITGAYLALVLPRPLDLLFTVVVAALTWLVVTQLVMPRLLIFGRRKLSTMVLIGAIIGWSAELLVRGLTNDAYVPWQGFILVTLMVPALLANDAQRQGLSRTAWGAAITTLAVFGTMNVLAAALGAAGVIST
ncbi:MAG: poly-gamma-glutamate biosynthesis protein PgsC/CapC [Candidatus Aldehydirespiratoraceae bacterium]